MPRKPKAELPPLESFEVEVDGVRVLCEVRDETCRLISRGSHKRDEYEDTLWEIMDKVIDDYFTPNGKKTLHPSKDYLDSADRFVNQACFWGLGSQSGDDGALRKRYYKDVLKQVQIFDNAIKSKWESLGTSCDQTE